MSQTTADPQTPPLAEPRPVTVAVSGVTFDDPFTWLEDDSDEALAWQQAQDAATQAYLRSWPHFDAVPGLLRRFEAPPIEFPVVRGQRSFVLTRGGGGERPHLEVRAPEAQPRVLVETEAETIDWWHASPAGRYVAYGLSSSGDEQSTLHVVDVDTAAVLPDTVPYASAAFVAWLPDESGFYVNAGRAIDQVDSRKELFFHELGGETREEPLPTPHLPIHGIPTISRDGRWLGILSYPGVHTHRLIWVRDRLADGPWERFAPDGPEQLIGDFDGDRYVAVTREGAPRGRVVSIPIITSQDLTTWEELVPENRDVIESIARVGEHTVVQRLRRACSALSILAPDGTEHDVALPALGTIGALAATGDRSFSFVFSSATTSPGRYACDVETGAVTVLDAPTHVLDGVTVQPFQAVSSDGTRVPAHIVRRADLDDGTPRPTVIYAYGGFNHRFTMGWDPRWAAFVESGGVYVHANLRGGGELGSEWWHGGRMAVKQNTFDDLYAIAEQLAADGVTTADQLGLFGASNGGMLAGAAAVQRPDLFGAIVANVPILDLLRVTRDPFPHSAMALDYGEPNDPEAAAWLATYSPYHNVVDGRAHTATLVSGGASDIRCPAWHSRKFVARLQQANTSDRPVLQRAYPSIGHNTGATLSDARLMATETLAFLMRELDLNPTSVSS